MLKIKLAWTMKISTLFAFFVSINGITPEIADKHLNQTSASSNISQTILSPNLTISSSPDPKSIKIGSKVDLFCKIRSAEMEQKIWWMKNERMLSDSRVELGDPRTYRLTTMRSKNDTGIKYRDFTANITITMNSEDDAGYYICMANIPPGTLINRTINIKIQYEPGKITSKHIDSVKLNEPAFLSCHVEGHRLKDFKWVKVDNSNKTEDLTSLGKYMKIDATRFIMTLNFTKVTRNNNGSYKCSVNDYQNTISSQCDLKVIEVPEVWINFITASGRSTVYLNWTVNDRNDPVKEYLIEYTKNATKKWEPYRVKIGGGNSSYVLEGFVGNSTYEFRIRARNSVGISPISNDSKLIKTWNEDLEFVPKVSILEKTDDDDDDDDDNNTHSITIVWSKPPEKLQNYIHSYEIMVSQGNSTKVKVNIAVEQDNIYNLIVGKFEYDANNYQFNVSACSNYTQRCGGWSTKKLDRLPVGIKPIKDGLSCIRLL